ncbi:MAG: hypothetical protein K2N18_00035 [Clostridia bacterium]|nr:hypothetical protein [Clostridia bacterium]
MATKKSKSTTNNLNPEKGPINVKLLNDKILAESGPNRIHYLEDLVSKQLDLYNWCEEKVSTLATIDSILLGAATLFIEKVLVVGESATLLNKIINVVMIVIVLLPLFISLAIALWHIRPKMGKRSNKGRPNHRSSNGIRHFTDVSEYQKKLLNMSDEEICEDLIKQIYGMNNNIWRNQSSIKMAVVFDLIGLVGFLAMIIYWAVL